MQLPGVSPFPTHAADVLLARVPGHARHERSDTAGFGGPARLGRQIGQEVSCGGNDRKQRFLGKDRSSCAVPTAVGMFTHEEHALRSGGASERGIIAQTEQWV